MYRKNLKPFSHSCSISCLVPGTATIVTVHPTRVVLKGRVLLLDIRGPVKNFTLFQDIEKRALEVIGHSREGYFRYFIGADGNLILKKSAFPFNYLWEGKKSTLNKGETLSLFPPQETCPFPERLFLGVAKSPDWDLIKRRADLKEIAPLWFQLGSSTPASIVPVGGTDVLLDRLEELIFQRKIDDIEESLLTAFLASFSHFLLPRLVDTDYQGISDEKPKKDLPLTILKRGAMLIRSLFFQEKGSILSLLPSLPTHFDAGQFTSIATSFGSLDIVFSKKLLRQAYLRSDKDATISFELQKSLTTFRLSKKVIKNGEPFEIRRGENYFFDRFQK